MSILGKIFATSLILLIGQIIFIRLLYDEIASTATKEVLGFFVLVWSIICVVTLILMIWL